jgi:hypothetical protein
MTTWATTKEEKSLLLRAAFYKAPKEVLSDKMRTTAYVLTAETAENGRRNRRKALNSISVIL